MLVALPQILHLPIFRGLLPFWARDRFAPKQFANLGDKLVFNNGIVLLGLFAAVLIVLKRGQVDALILRPTPQVYLPRSRFRNLPWLFGGLASVVSDGSAKPV